MLETRPNVTNNTNTFFTRGKFLVSCALFLGMISVTVELLKCDTLGDNCLSPSTSDTMATTMGIIAGLLLIAACCGNRQRMNEPFPLAEEAQDYEDDIEPGLSRMRNQ